MKFFYRTLLLLCIPLLLSGCEFKDIDKRFFVVTIGIDQGTTNPEKMAVTFKMAIPTGAPKMGQEDFQTFTVESDSITEAMQKIKTHIDKELDFGHASALIIGESLAKKNIGQAIDWLTRERFIQEVGWMAIGKPTAKDVLDVRPRFERLPSNALFLTFGGTGVESQFRINQPLFAFYRNFYEPGIDPILSVIQESGNHLTIDHAVIFKHGRLKKILTDRETRLFNLLDGRIGHADLKVEMDSIVYGVHIDNYSAKFAINPTADGGTIQTKVKMRGILEERSKTSTVTKQSLEKIGDQLASDLTKEIREYLTEMQKENLDPLGFGLMYRAHQWEKYETEVSNWKKIYPKLKFDAQVEVEIESSGTIR